MFVIRSGVAALLLHPVVSYRRGGGDGALVSLTLPVKSSMLGALFGLVPSWLP
jgi:hypothetical protein